MKNHQHDSYQQRSPRLKFWQQMYLGIGGAMVFGLVAALGSGLVDVVGAAGSGAILAGGAPMFAALGLAGLAIAGVGCLYLGSKFLAENIALDQENQARKISAMIGVSRVQELTAPAPTPTVSSTPPGMGGTETIASEKPSNQVNSAVAFDRLQSAGLQAARA